jgi:AraC family transcriptional regulator
MSTENRRIVARQHGDLLPLFGEHSKVPLSPSRTLLIERHDLDPSDWQTHSIEDHVLTLFLKPTTILHALGSHSVRPIPIAYDNVVLSLRHQQESIRWTEPASILSVAIGDGVLRKVADNLQMYDNVEILPSPGLDDLRVKTLLHALDVERELGYPTGRLFVDGIEQALATLLITSYSANKPEPIFKKAGLAPVVLARVIDFMQGNLAQQIGLDDLAICAGLSTSHFSRQFKESTGTTPHQHLLALRIEHCKRMLRDTRLSVLEIALTLGFQSAQHLAVVFRRMVGVPPSVYRRQL